MLIEVTDGVVPVIDRFILLLLLSCLMLKLCLVSLLSRLDNGCLGLRSFRLALVCLALVEEPFREEVDWVLRVCFVKHLHAFSDHKTNLIRHEVVSVRAVT